MHKTDPNNVRSNIRYDQEIFNGRSRDKENFSGAPQGRSRLELQSEEIIKISRSNDLYERQSI